MDHHHHVKVGPSRGSGANCNNNNNNNNKKNNNHEEDDMDLRRGPWTVEEDFTLMNYIAHHGEGRWNSLARCAGLKRTGKSCRLRWLNYLRPDVRRGNITLEEQLLILELHSRWGNRWSKIAQHLPGRTDNEIKNYWRTRVQKHAKQLKCDVNSKQFKDTMRYLWMPRLVERIQAAANKNQMVDPNNNMGVSMSHHEFVANNNNISNNNSSRLMSTTDQNNSSAAATSSENSFGTTQVSPVNSDITDCCFNYPQVNQDYYQVNNNHQDQLLTSPTGNYFHHGGLDQFQGMDDNQQQQQNLSSQWMDGGNNNFSDNLWNIEDMWFLQQQLNNNNVV